MNPDFTSYPTFTPEQEKLPSWYQNNQQDQPGYVQNNQVQNLQETPRTPVDSQWVENTTFQSTFRSEVSTLEEGSKMHGDKLKSEWQNKMDLENSKDWREQRPSFEGTKVHGDALLNPINEPKPEWKQSDFESVNTGINNLNLENKENKENVNQWNSTNLENKDSLNWENKDKEETKYRDWKDKEYLKWDSKPYVPFTSAETKNWDKVDLLFSRSYARDLDKLEEEERQRRIKNGRNNEYFATLQKINSDILKRNASILPSIATATEVIKEKTANWTGYTSEILSNLSHDVIEKTKQFVDVARDSLGYSDPSSLTSVTKEEEKERIRRMNEKVDPMVDARRRRVEDELIHTVKLAN